MRKMNFYNTNGYVPDNSKPTQLLTFSTHRIPISQPAPYLDYSPSTAEPSKKITWGEPTWFLFHTLAHKIRDDMFPLLKGELFNLIKTICSTLPCQDCATHATNYMNNINFQAIITKEQLKDMLFVFHNSVNAKKGYPLFPRDQLDKKYDLAVTSNIINNFSVHFEKKTNNLRMTPNNFHRTRAIYRIKEWFKQYIQFFDP